MAGPYGSGSYGTSPYGSAPSPFRVLSASGQGQSLVEVVFSEPLDPAFSALASPSNYTIAGLTVLAVSRSYDRVLLTTSAQADQTYTVAVASARSLDGRPLVPWGRTADFTGILNPVGVRAVPTAPARLRLVFDEAMSPGDALTNPASYHLVTVAGQTVPVAQVLPEQGGNPRSVVLVLGAAMVSGQQFVVTLSSGLHTPSGRGVFPLTLPFTWVAGAASTQVPLDQFTGEVTGGLLGQHAGLVFFSPALLAPVAASVIQVEDVSVCTKAYDTYTVPKPLDPPVLFLNQVPVAGAVLWAKNALSEAHLDLDATHPEAMPEAVDGRCVGTLVETLAASYVSYLNNPHWTLNGQGGALFICTNNSGAIPAGPTTTVTLA